MILDTFTTVFVWIGSLANEEEKSHAIKVAQDYIDQAADGEETRRGTGPHGHAASDICHRQVSDSGGGLLTWSSCAATCLSVCGA